MMRHRSAVSDPQSDPSAPTPYRHVGHVQIWLAAERFAGGGAAGLPYTAPTITHATTIISVTTTADQLSFPPGSGCSLREAIQAANTDAAVDDCPAGSGADTITVPSGTYTLSIPGANEDANATETWILRLP